MVTPSSPQMSGDPNDFLNKNSEHTAPLLHLTRFLALRFLLFSNPSWLYLLKTIEKSEGLATKVSNKGNTNVDLIFCLLQLVRGRLLYIHHLDVVRWCHKIISLLLKFLPYFSLPQTKYFPWPYIYFLLFKVPPLFIFCNNRGNGVIVVKMRK